MFDPIYLPATWHLNLKNNFNIAKVIFLDPIITVILNHINWDSYAKTDKIYQPVII